MFNKQSLLLRNKIVFAVVLSLCLVSPFAVYADNISQSIKEPLIKPNGGFYYIFKRGYEKILEKFQFSNASKLNYHQNLLLNRFSELKYVAEKNDVGELQTSTQRFSYEAGKLAQLSGKLNSTDNARIQNLFREYKPVLERLRDLYPANSSFWMLLQHDINTLEILSKKLQS